MASKLFLSLFLMISSWVIVGFCQGGDSGGASMPCVQKLLPCQPYLKSLSSPPPSTCCIPLKEMISGDAKCLCEIFNNAQLLKNFNISQDDALKLPKACGTEANISACKTGAAGAPTGSPATPSNGSSTSNSTSSPTTKSAANYGISHVRGSALIAFLLVLIISAF
uniref:Putative lipid transfer-like protein VAS n=1 Tax=Davidia involucrata TaxID=16924 RepID=A0A5B7BCT9_DAVIN